MPIIKTVRYKMSYHKILVAFILISNTLSVNCELSMEKIIGGVEAFPENYRYEVGIIGKHNGTYTRFMACTGGIIADYFILGDAECFFDANNELMKLKFFVILGSINLRYDYKNAKNVIYIYTYTEFCISNRHNIAILQLEHSLNLNNSTTLSKLMLPPKGAKSAVQGRVAGFGFKSLEEKSNQVGNSRPKLNGIRDFVLTQINVTTTDNQGCYYPYRLIDPMKEMCGLVQLHHPLDRGGLCTYDEGAPLVVEDAFVVGIAKKNRPDCDNTNHGNLYTKVTYYLDFINGVITRNHTEDTVAHVNRLHLANIRRKPY